MDLFELTKLPFDFSENDNKEHEKAVNAIKKKIRDINGEINNVSDKARLIEQRTFLEGFLNDAKNALRDISEYERQKTQKTNKVMEAFKATVNNMEKLTVPEEYVKDFSEKTGLAMKRVWQYLEEIGFKIIKFEMKLPKFPERAKIQTIKNELANLQKFSALQIPDIYSFIAYLKDDIDNDYSSLPAGELQNILSQYARDYPGHQASPIDMCVRIAAAAVSLFDDKQSYDNYLLYNSPKMTELISRIKTLPESSLRVAETANNIIMEIERIFPDKDNALSIYNDAAGFGRKGKLPFIPPIIQYYIKCGHCGHNLAFKSETERNNTKTCRNCKNPLYKQCNKCKKDVLVTLDKCPHCEFVFASAGEFLKYIADADRFRRKGDFESARRSLDRAITADPSEKARFNELRAKIESDEKIYAEPINKLRELTTKKQFHAALAFYSDSIIKYPNIATFEAEIKSALSKAQSIFDNAKNRNPSERAEICLDILNYCADFHPALQYLGTQPPIAVSSLNLSIDNANNNILINWSRSLEKGVTYCIVRKTGKDAPSNIRDGTILKDNISDIFYNDNSVSPGSYYSYAVFVKRMGIYSTPKTAVILFVADVTNVNHEQNGNSLRITWNLPNNSIGVSISRNQNGKEVILTENAQSSFEDKNLEYGKPYSYTLKANYFGLPASTGVKFVLTILPRIEQFKISVVKSKNNIYKISWNITRNDIDLRVLVNKKLVREIKSNQKDCEIEIPQDGFYTVEAAAFSGGNWLTSENSVEVNTYTSCEISKEYSQIKESLNKLDLSIKIAGEIPHNVSAFWYVVRTRPAESPNAPWSDNSDIYSANDVYKISIDNYRQKGELTYTNTARDEDAYYVTMFTIYNLNGNEIISSPCKRKFERPLDAQIIWSVSKPFFGKWKLTVEIRANRAILGHPKLVLCSCSLNSHLISSDDGQAEEILTIEETFFDSKTNIFKQDFELETSKVNKNKKLFLFEKNSDTNKHYSLLWADGFNGKI